MIVTSQLEKGYGDRTLFEEVTLKLNAGSRYGLVGANGSGKTTFLKVLASDEPATGGNFSMPSGSRMGVLRQDHFLDDAQIILDLAMMGDAPVFHTLQERARIIDHGEGDPTRLADLEDRLAHADGYTLEARATAVLEGLGIPMASHRMPLATLSGGFKLRVLLAQVLVGGPDVLLLDEPTNHLDILSIRWLEKFLGAYRGVAVIISHDQRFLDNVATHILDVDYATITPYTGNYAAFAAEKKLARERKEGEIAQTEKVIEHKRAYVERFRYKASKARQAQSILKQIDRIEVEELKTSSRRAPLFRFDPERPSGKDVLEVSHVSKAYGEKRVLRDVSLRVRRGEKVGIIGANGLGKSTLLKIVTANLAADEGAAKFGHETRIGYFPQDHHELLDDPEVTALDYLWRTCPTEATSYVRGQLGRMLFSGEDVDKKIGTLSGGESARLIFSRLVAAKPNVLVLDEPTNHLDLEAIGALVDGLRAFEGTVIFVSHDRFFVSELATRIVEVTAEGLLDFPGTYGEYLEKMGDDHLDAAAVVSKARTARAAERKDQGAEPSANALAREEQRRRRSRVRTLESRRDALLASIEAAEMRKNAIAEQYAKPGFFERTLKSEVLKLESESTGLVEQIAALLVEWESVETELLTLAT
ncbi:MAG TPA: ABC-F family ATP-binding cassette domain-containing protein [Polyangiaceae bacterium]|nr:ABC-F family ATP-binding cassette domain-containing protein [Polyangiaceae bacterium]